MKYDDVRNHKTAIACFSIDIFEQLMAIKTILREKVYYHPRVKLMNKKAQRIITDLFNFYLENQMRCQWQLEKLLSKTLKNDRVRIICDYIAGMTDRYVMKRHKIT